MFFGGTALARTLVPDARLREDIDLTALGSRTASASALERPLASALRRSHGRITWAQRSPPSETPRPPSYSPRTAGSPSASSCSTGAATNLGPR